MRPTYLILPALLSAAAAQAQPPIRLVREFTIDGSSGVSFGRLGRMELGPDGAIVMADEANGVIYRFTPAGKFRDSLGRKGQGPGEFLLAAGIGIGPGGEIALADLRTRRLTIWNPDGKFRNSGTIGSGMPFELLWRGADPIIGVMTFTPGSGATASLVPATVGEQVVLKAPLATFPDPTSDQMAQAVSCGLCVHALGPNGNLVVAAPDTFYRMSELGSGGKVLRSWARPGIGAGLRTEEEAAALRARLARGPGGGAPTPESRAPRPAVPGSNGSSFRWRFQGIGFDAAGRLLALVSNAGSTSPVVDVFAGDGKFLGTVKLAEHLTGMVIRGNRMLGQGETADGEHVIHVYRIEALPGR
ncbi:MAG: hypothetical protein HOP28_04590 [Gemmatimonadales bacterium]|nr:hypothetical protein [Gemmatimonadales bacterium]